MFQWLRSAFNWICNKVSSLLSKKPDAPKAEPVNVEINRSPTQNSSYVDVTGAMDNWLNGDNEPPSDCVRKHFVEEFGRLNRLADGVSELQKGTAESLQRANKIRQRIDNLSTQIDELDNSQQHTGFVVIHGDSKKRQLAEAMYGGSRRIRRGTPGQVEREDEVFEQRLRSIINGYN